MNDVSAVVEHAANVLGVDGAREVRVAVVRVVLLAVGLTALLRDLEEVVPDEVLGPGELPIRSLVYLLKAWRKHGHQRAVFNPVFTLLCLAFLKHPDCLGLVCVCCT